MAIYALLDPRTKRVRYVGQGVLPNNRLRTHARRPHSHKLRQWIGELNRSGLTPELKILKGYKTEAAAIRWQRPDLNTVAGQSKPQPVRDMCQVSFALPREKLAIILEAIRLDGGDDLPAHWFRREGMQAARRMIRKKGAK